MTPSLDKLLMMKMIKNELENETATWFDVGTRLSLNGQWAGSLNYYYALWSDRAQSGTSEDLNGAESFSALLD